MNAEVRAIPEFSAFFHMGLITEASAVLQTDFIDDSQSRGFRGSLYCV
jgi:hypothetical protein